MRIAVLGGGSWGTTLASLTAATNDTVLWARAADVVDDVNHRHRNSAFLPGFELCVGLDATGDLAVALDGAEVVVVAIPSSYLRSVVDLARGALASTALVVSATKGIEIGTGARMSEVIIDALDHDPGRVCVLSGPNLAREVLAGQPSATVLACTDGPTAELLSRALTTESFRVFSNRDVIGCEVGGAAKNVIAIAAGIGDGMGYGWNTKAALMTRGLAEIARLGVALGADPMTFLGLAGNGDLTATCSSTQSRNRHVGHELGSGRPLSEIVAEMNMVAEGVSSTPAIGELARRLGVSMPITHKVGAVLDGSLSPSEAVNQLMAYEPGSETDPAV